MATWRNGRPPIRFSEPVHVVLPRHDVVLYPFQGQPKKYAEPRRLPGLEVRKSGIPKAGNGLWLAERVRAGQTITLFRRKRISEAAAKKLHNKVLNAFIRMLLMSLTQWFAGESAHSRKPCSLLVLGFEASRIRRGARLL
jgi:hypothetical protein